MRAGPGQKGYKVHAVWNGGPMFTTWALAALNVSEKTIAKNLLIPYAASNETSSNRCNLRVMSEVNWSAYVVDSSAMVCSMAA